MRHDRLGHWGILAATVATLLAGTTAVAGPGTYDPKTREFTLTYTYARLPGVGIVGEPVRPSDQMDANVRAFIAQVGSYLAIVTDGRGKLGTPQLVDSVARADVVISPDNSSDRAAWATPAGFGKQGNVYIYYRYLSEPGRPRDGVAMTVVHELCHYIFDMPDEYPDPSDGAPDRHCPADPSGAGPGCLMDNYWSRPWYQHPCGHDHNTSVVSRRLNRRYPDSCQSKIDAFFAERGVVGGQPAESETGTGTGTSAPQGGTPDGEATKVRGIVESALARVRLNVHKVGHDQLRSFAAHLVRDGLKKQNLARTEGEIGKSVDVIMKAAAFVAADPPTRFRMIAAALRDAAVRFARSGAGKDEASRIADVKAELLRLAVAQAPPDGGAGYDAADLAYLESLARTAVLSPAAGEEKPKDKDDVLFQMLRYLFEATRDLSADSDPAVARVMSDHLHELDQAGRQLGLTVPVRARFGTRRTMIIAPDPTNDAYDLIPLQSGIFSYKVMRDLYLKQFARLIQRNSLEFNKIDLRQRIETDVDDQFGVRKAGGARDVQNLGSAPGDAGPRPSPQANIGELLDAILDDIRKDQLENVAVLIPPGGLPGDLNDFLKTFRNENLVRRSDIRLDVVVVGAQPVPSLLMDMVERSGGVVLTIADIHETGAIAQRLKNEQSAGAWITVPRQFDLPCGERPARALADGLRGAAPAGAAGAPIDLDADYKKARILLDPKNGAIDSVGGKIVAVRGQLDRMVKEATGPDANAPVLPNAAAAIVELQKGFNGDGGVVPRLQQLVPIVERIRAQFNRIPEIDAIPAIEGMPDEPPVLPELKKRAALRVLRDIAAAKQILIGIDRGLRPALLKQLTDLEATLQASNPAGDPKTPAGTLQGEVKTLLTNADDLYNELYADVRTVERGIASVLLPVNARIGLVNYEKQIRTLDPEDPMTVENVLVPRMERLYRVPFFGEEDAEYEIIVGLSHIPPFQIPSRQQQFAGQELVRVELLDDKGSLSAYSDSMRLDPSVSTPTMRVYRLPKMAGRRSQRFQLRVVPNTDYAGGLLEDVVRYTVSIASLRPNVELNAGLVYETLTPAEAARAKKLSESDPDRLPPLSTIRGTFSSLLPGPVIEVSVYGGTPILGANVKGLYQVLGKNNPLDRFPTIDFRDDGMTPDRARDDGIYTAQIPVDGAPIGGADYRLGIQVFATDKQPTRNVPFEPSDEASAKRTEANLKENKKADFGAPQDAPPLLFQRATSLHFRVEK